jgi:TonB family protein
MLLKEEEKNIYTAILGTASFHLLILVAFLIVQLGEVKIEGKEQVVIEFDEQAYKAIQEYAKQMKPLNTYSDKAAVVKGADAIRLSQDAIKNIAVNTSEKIKDQISTEKYIEQVKQELGIKELNQQLDRSVGEEPIAEDANANKNTPPPPAEKKMYHGPTRISYSLEGRSDRYMHVPVYKCESSGNVIVNIVVSPAGAVIGESVESSSTSDECLIEAAIDAAHKSQFSIELKAESRERGTISYEFVAQ